MLKKKSKKVLTPAWHPNFRNAESLPDIKAIRSTFFINTACLSIAIALMGYFSYVEYRGTLVTKEIATLQERIAEKQKSNAQFLELSQEFKRIGRRIDEMEEFYNVPLQADGFLAELAAATPSEIILQSVSLQEDKRTEDSGKKKEEVTVSKLSVAGTVSGEDPTAVFTEYKKTLGELPQLADSVANVQEFPSIDEALGLLTFRLEIELKEPRNERRRRPQES